MSKKLVWYASYGSNLSRERFLCYIRGGTPPGSTQEEKGSRDHSTPLKDEPIVIRFPLYFAKHSERWGGAPAFIGHRPISGNLALGRKYLITQEQFFDVVSQENGGIDIQIDIEQLHRAGSITFREAWYGRIMYLGEKEGFPIYTFTAPWEMNEVEYGLPSKEYLKTIILGLIEAYRLSNGEIANYLLTKPGINGRYREHALKELIQSAK